MATRSVNFCANEHYHVYNRGNSKQAIFRDDYDYARFIQLLYLANTSDRFNVRDVLTVHNSVFEQTKRDELVTIHAFCLMPNHFHLITTPLSDTGLSTFMLKLATAYSMYFNRKHDRTGKLFEGTFKAKHLDEDRYLKYLFSYIHLNPSDLIETGRTIEQFDFVATYPYSSLHAYSQSSPRGALGIDAGAVSKCISTEMYRGYFASPRSVRQELFEWITYDEEEVLGSN